MALCLTLAKVTQRQRAVLFDDFSLVIEQASRE